MAVSELIHNLSSLSKKIDSLLERQTYLQNRIRDLEKENQELRLQHDADLISLNKAQKEIDFLTLSHRLAASPEALISARNKVSKLIRTIDNCIRLMNED